MKNIETEINEKYYDNQGNYLGEKKIITTKQVPIDEDNINIQQEGDNEEEDQEQEEVEEYESENANYVDSNENEVETQLVLNTVNSLNGYTNTKITIPATEKALYTTSVKAGDTNYNQKYRLRIWIDTTAEYLTQNNGVDTYPLEGKTYSLTVNVYGVVALPC